MHPQHLNLFDTTLVSGNGQVPGGMTPASSILNYTTTTPLGSGGVKTWFKRNVVAIELLKQIEAVGRRATAEEQAILVEYVG